MTSPLGREIPKDDDVHIHAITLHCAIAGLWEDVAMECGIFQMRQSDKIITKGRGKDLHAAWELFVEKHQQIISK